MAKVGQLNPRRVRAWAWEMAMRNRRKATERRKGADRKFDEWNGQILNNTGVATEEAMAIREAGLKLLQSADEYDRQADRYISMVQHLNDLPGCGRTTAEEDLKAIGRGEKL